MRVDVYVPLLLSALLGAGGPLLGRLLPPAAAVRLLVPASVLTAGCWVWTLGLLVWTAIAQLSFVAARGHWSRQVLRSHDPVAGPVAWAAGIALLLVAVLLVTITVRRVRAVWRTRRLARTLGRAQAGQLIVLAGEDPCAFALPVGRGRIVVTRAMLRALDADERRVLLAHERAHLRGRHHLWMFAAELVAAADPLLARLPPAVDHLLERSADESAAAEVGDRRLAARAVCRAGLAIAGHGAAAPALALRFGAGRIPARVRALLADPLPMRWAPVLLVTAALAVTMVAAVDAGCDYDRVLDVAVGAPAVRHAAGSAAAQVRRGAERGVERAGAAAGRAAQSRQAERVLHRA